jgi:hypothetical protein
MKKTEIVSLHARVTATASIVGGVKRWPRNGRFKKALKAVFAAKALKKALEAMCAELGVSPGELTKVDFEECTNRQVFVAYMSNWCAFVAAGLTGRHQAFDPTSNRKRHADAKDFGLVLKECQRQAQQLHEHAMQLQLATC